MRQYLNVNNLARFAAALLLLVVSSFAAQAAFTSLYVFGDGVSTTTNNSSPLPKYGKRYCNGRVWVEVLAQWQGLGYDSNKNWSYFGHYSPNLVANVSNFAPPDAQTALFVVWVNNADFVYDLQHYRPFITNNIAIWTNAINQSLTNHLKAVTNLYANGVRTLVMPNAVDITKTYADPGLTAAEKSFIRQRIIDFNAAFAVRLSNAATSLSGLKIHVPDAFALLDSVVANPAAYGLINPGNDAITDLYPSGDYSLNGPGANYVFWDYLHPTAKFQMVLAEITQQLLSPARISNIVSLAGSNRLDMENIPIGRNGFVDGGTNLVNWTPDTNITSTATTQTTLVPSLDSRRFYRLRFPFVWSWP